MSQLRLLGLVVALTAAIGLMACGDDEEGGDGTAASEDLARYCELARELDEVGSETFKALEQDPKATPQDFAKAEADFVEEVNPQLDEIAEVAPEEIQEEAQVLVASVRARGKLKTSRPMSRRPRRAETTIQQFEKRTAQANRARSKLSCSCPRASASCRSSSGGRPARSRPRSHWAPGPFWCPSAPTSEGIHVHPHTSAVRDDAYPCLRDHRFTRERSLVRNQPRPSVACAAASS